MPKTLSNTYLFNRYSDYEKEMFKFIMSSERLPKGDDSFSDIKYEVKRCNISNSLIGVLESNNIVLCNSGLRGLSKSTKVFAAKDVKTDGKLRVFIDCSGLIVNDNGVYKCNNMAVLLSYLVSAMNTLIYYSDEKRITSNQKLTTSGAACFSGMMVYVLDYIYKISVSGSALKDKCKYLCSLYYSINILGKTYEDAGARATARKISGLSEREEDIIKLKLNDNSFDNIKFFCEALASVLMLNKFTCDLLIEKWMWLFGTGTVFGLELYPSFASIITDAYIGGHINNQKTIEKIIGSDMVDFHKTVIEIGNNAITGGR